MKADELLSRYAAGERDFEGADLRRAYLEGADLRGADLRGADLRGAYLEGADLRGADLRGAYLRGAYLAGANLADADLTGTCLDPDRHVQVLEDAEITGAGLEIDTVDGREIVRGWRTRRSQHMGSHEYTPGWHEAPVLSLDTTTECHPGIYLSSAEWFDVRDWYRGFPRVRCWCYRDELVHAGDKWRAQRIFVENYGGERASGCTLVAKLASEIEGELNKLQHALLTIERSGAPGATICSQRTDGHACGWCRGMLTPCPVMIARTALEKHSTRLTDEPVNSGSCNDGEFGEKCDQS